MTATAREAVKGTAKESTKESAKESAAEKEALEKLGLKEKALDFREAGLDKKFASRVTKRQDIKAQMDALKKELDDLNAEIGADLEASGHKTVIAGDWRVTVADGVHRSLSKEKLLELGVAAKTILAATTESHYSMVKVTEARKKEE